MGINVKFIQKIIISQIDIKIGEFLEELDAVLKKLKTIRLKDSMKYSLKYGRLEKLTTYNLNNASVSINNTY